MGAAAGRHRFPGGRDGGRLDPGGAALTPASDSRWTPERRFRIDVLTSLTHESEIHDLFLVLAQAPPAAESFLAELVEDGIVTLEDGGDGGAQRGRVLSQEQALALLASHDARVRDDVWIRTTAHGATLERDPGRLFRYVLGDRSAVSWR